MPGRLALCCTWLRVTGFLCIALIAVIRRHRRLREIIVNGGDGSLASVQSLQVVNGTRMVHPDAVADHTTGETLLHVACKSNALNCVKVLLRRGANAVTVDVSATTMGGFRPTLCRVISRPLAGEK